MPEFAGVELRNQLAGERWRQVSFDPPRIGGLAAARCEVTLVGGDGFGDAGELAVIVGAAA